VILLFQERVAIEADHFVGDASYAEHITNGLRYQNDYLHDSDE
jgi:hypothetical protein